MIRSPDFEKSGDPCSRGKEELSFDAKARFLRTYVPSEFGRCAGHPRRFVDRTTGVSFDFLVTGRFPGSGQPGPIAYPDPENVSQTIDSIRVVNLATLIELKLAAGRHKDFGDVVELIRVHNLNESFIPKIHPSVHGEFTECLEEKRREDEYGGSTGDRMMQ